MINFSPAYDEIEDFRFAILNFPHLDSNIPTASAYGVYISRSSLQFVCEYTKDSGYGVYISQLIPYARACSLYADLFTSQSIEYKLLNHGFF